MDGGGGGSLHKYVVISTKNIEAMIRQCKLLPPDAVIIPATVNVRVYSINNVG